MAHKHHFTKMQDPRLPGRNIYECRCGLLYGKSYKGWITKGDGVTPLSGQMFLREPGFWKNQQRLLGLAPENTTSWDHWMARSLDRALAADALLNRPVHTPEEDFELDGISMVGAFLLVGAIVMLLLCLVFN